MSAVGSQEHPRRPPPWAPWPKGRSGNPGGKPKGASVLSAMRRLAAQRVGTKTRASQIAGALLRVAADTDHPHWPAAVRLVLERLDPPKLEELGAGVSITVRPTEIHVQIGNQTREIGELEGPELTEAARAYLASLTDARALPPGDEK